MHPPEWRTERNGTTMQKSKKQKQIETNNIEELRRE